LRDVFVEAQQQPLPPLSRRAPSLRLWTIRDEAEVDDPRVVALERGVKELLDELNREREERLRLESLLAEGHSYVTSLLEELDARKREKGS
jgi:hypothetical protein